jgi:hypothetical protein
LNKKNLELQDKIESMARAAKVLKETKKNLNIENDNLRKENKSLDSQNQIIEDK